MADAWQTFPFEFKGGLITNLSPLQHGIQAPGSARILKNFEPSISGGYRRIEGFTKFDSDHVPMYGEPLVHGSGQTGTTLTVGNLFTSPSADDTFTIAGVTGTYTIASASYNSTTKRATLILTTSLASSPADKAALTFAENVPSLVKGVAVWQLSAIASRNNDLYASSGTGWTKINKPSYGTVLVNGGSQTGTSLDVDGLTSPPKAGDTFTINGVAKIYTVTADATVTSGGATLTIDPALASSPSDNAAITFLTKNYSNGSKLRNSKYRIGTTEKIICVDSNNYPFIWDGTTFSVLDNHTTDILGAEFVVFYKNQMFFAKGDTLVFTAPFTDTDFSVANGAGSISVGGQITGMVVFREELIIFTERTISKVVGNTLADFQLQPITKNVGCVAPDTIQEISGDVLFLGPDGLRLLGATDRTNDFNLGVVSKPIQTETTNLISSSTYFSSVVIKKKTQYRIFGYSQSVNASSSKGLLGTQMQGDNASSIAWGETIGIKAYAADSEYRDQAELILFSHNDGHVYRMEDGDSFDGSNILASFATPYTPINDPRVRKTFYKLFLYTDPQGSVTMSANLKLDFDDYGSIQPDTINLSNDTGAVGFYGSTTARYGTTVYGAKLKRIFQTQVVGSGFSVSLQVISDGQDPAFSLDAATLEYSTHDRR